jgi:hypothetical protein
MKEREAFEILQDALLKKYKQKTLDIVEKTTNNKHAKNLLNIAAYLKILK